MKSILYTLSLSLFLINYIQAQTTVTLNCDRDNTLYENGAGATSNGSGFQFFAGRVALNSNDLRRGLIHFDLSTIPANATIISCNLSLTVNDVVSNNSSIISLHRVEKDWGEAASDAIVDEVAGAPSLIGDATWTENIKGTSNWINLGGDYKNEASASNSIQGPGTYTWVGAAMVTDLQKWVNNPSENYGWMLIGDESIPNTAKRFTSRENSPIASQLTLTYSVLSSAANRTNNSIKIFPNPVQSYLIIKDKSSEIESFQIFDAMGKDYTLDYNYRDEGYTIDTEKLEQGLYFIAFKTKHSINYYSFVKKS